MGYDSNYGRIEGYYWAPRIESERVKYRLSFIRRWNTKSMEGRLQRRMLSNVVDLGKWKLV